MGNRLANCHYFVGLRYRNCAVGRHRPAGPPAYFTGNEISFGLAFQHEDTARSYDGGMHSQRGLTICRRLEHRNAIFTAFAAVCVALSAIIAWRFVVERKKMASDRTGPNDWFPAE